MNSDPISKLSIELEMVDQSGKLILSRSEAAHSWLRNAWNYIFACISGCGGGNISTFGPGYMSSKTQAGQVYASSSYNMDRYSYSVVQTYGLVPSNTANQFGLMVGSGLTPFNIDQHALTALIAHGSAAGQLSYSAETNPTLSYENKIWRAAHRRILTNLSPGSVTINELGLGFYGCLFTSNNYFLLSRDVLSSPVVVESLAVLQITFNIDYDFTLCDTI